jgi:hypothetical protein
MVRRYPMNRSAVSSFNPTRLFERLNISRGLVFGILIIAALLAFEIFNYSTTEFALSDLLGDLQFLSVRWATILAIAFCGIDFAGIARLFTPEQGDNEPKEIWYLFGAWLLAATMNAMLTWWGVSIAILNHQSLGGEVMNRELMIKVVPIFVAVMVWLIRVLIIGTFSVAGDRLFSQSDVRRSRRNRPAVGLASSPSITSGRVVTPQNASSFRPKPKTTNEPERTGYSRPEPTYHPMGMSSTNHSNNPITRR